jgi:cytochrome d ubiquinol oxidase subunit I
MILTALLLSRLQFAFTITFHIIFPSFTIGLAAWLCVLEGLHLVTARPVYRRLFDFWLKIFGVAFGMGVVSGIVMGFEFGTNWSRLAEATGPIQGPLITYETFTNYIRDVHSLCPRGFILRRADLWPTARFPRSLLLLHLDGGSRYHL